MNFKYFVCARMCVCRMVRLLRETGVEHFHLTVRAATDEIGILNAKMTALYVHWLLLTSNSHSVQ